MNNPSQKDINKQVNISSKKLCKLCKKNKIASKSYSKIKLTICEECDKKYKKDWSFKP